MTDHIDLANRIRALTIDAVEAASARYTGAAMAMADAAAVLFRNHPKFDAAAPHWSDRSLSVLQNVDASMMLYSLSNTLVIGSRIWSCKVQRP